MSVLSQAIEISTIGVSCPVIHTLMRNDTPCGGISRFTLQPEPGTRADLSRNHDGITAVIAIPGKVGTGFPSRFATSLKRVLHMSERHRKRLVAGNWKMNGVSTDLNVIRHIADAAHDAPHSVEIVLCLPTTLLARAAQMLPVVDRLQLGGQDCHAERSGAFTGDVSADMLSDSGASHVIVGHSERRAGYRETDEMVRAKADAALSISLIPIICVGESLQDREAGKAAEVVTAQIRGSVPASADAGAIVIAYEPVWAIGTGRSATLDDIAAMHGTIRETLIQHLNGGADARILYGGSVKPGNAGEILRVEAVDGVLVGGASLTVHEFSPIIEAAATLARQVAC
ncbi:MAG: triose-phosphate isomerase [Pseudomonadota bacterium]